ncbi:hypothetical protein CEE35_01985 [Candidatus Aerophobetes bacterium Ae_b3b]|nr:MAG: hypothetical protein CEE35_01985 [Candidatus Aerophobetes bacterium Ae_b3b]
MSKVLCKIRFALLFLLFLLSIVASLPAEEGLFNDLDAYIRESMKDWQVPYPRCPLPLRLARMRTILRQDQGHC